MTIDVWAEDKFKKPNETMGMREQILMHRRRQLDCYSDCLKHLHEAQRTWTMLIDIDEYISFNPIVAEDGSGKARMKAWKEVNLGNLSSVYPYKLAKVLSKGESRSREETLMDARTRVPRAPFVNKKTIVDFMAEEKENMPFNDSSCIVLPRLQFGDKMEASKLINPNGFDANAFNTLKYFTHHMNAQNNVNGPGKSIVHASRMKDLKVINVHRINQECGGRGSAFPNYATSLFRINHYAGSKESFLLKEHHKHNEASSRRSDQGKTFDFRAKVDHAKSFDMQGWIQSFSNDVGMNKAKELLRENL